MTVSASIVLRRDNRLDLLGRQTEGLGRALMELMGVDVAIPHHTSLTKRAAKLIVIISVEKTQGPINVVIDSTGLKVYGEGE